MENNELYRRAEDLLERCGKSGSVTHTSFLTPAERYKLENWAKHRADCRIVFHGGGIDCERHRDYMGAILGMGIGREWLGDIRVEGSKAYVFCLPSVLRHLLGIEKVGRVSVKAEEVPLSAIPAPKRQVKELSFSVMSMRLDAIAAGMFHLSRTEASRQIEAGALSLNYEECLKTDKSVQEGDILSLRGAGKGKILGTGGTSRKGRLFVYAEVYQ